jgi:predicted permease
MLFGLAPALLSTRAAPIDALKTDGRRAVAGGAGRITRGLVVTQMGLSLVLVVAAGLLVRTFDRLANLPLGFDSQRVLVANVDTSRVPMDPAGRILFYDRLAGAVAALPGVERAAASAWTPMSGGGGLFSVEVPGYPQTADRRVIANFITPGWFATYGTPLREGRDIDARDTATSSPVLVVNDAFARRFFAGRSAVGGTVGAARQIVGVVKDAVFRAQGMIPGAASLALREAVPPMIYIPLAQSAGMRPPGSTVVSLSIRSASGSPVTLARSVAAALAAVDGELTFTFRPLADYVNAALAQERMLAMLSGFFGGLALLLAALGLYGVTSYSVVRRQTEIGIRMALGAQRSQVIGLVLRHSLGMVAGGILLGLGAAAVVTRYLAGLLFGLTPLDPATFAAVSAMFASIATLAALIPARRATRVDPLVALRSE